MSAKSFILGTFYFERDVVLSHYPLMFLYNFPSFSRKFVSMYVHNLNFSNFNIWQWLTKRSRLNLWMNFVLAKWDERFICLEMYVSSKRWHLQMITHAGRRTFVCIYTCLCHCVFPSRREPPMCWMFSFPTRLLNTLPEHAWKGWVPFPCSFHVIMWAMFTDNHNNVLSARTKFEHAFIYDIRHIYHFCHCVRASLNRLYI